MPIYREASMRHQAQAEYLQRLRGLCEQGRLESALDVVDRMCGHKLPIPTTVFYCLIQGCIQKRDLNAGKRLHGLVLSGRDNVLTDPFLGSHLIHMFSSCGDVVEAGAIFESLAEPTAFSWSAIIQANVRHGRSREAIALYGRMMQQSSAGSVRPDGHVFVAALKACSDVCDIANARFIHACAAEELMELRSEGVVSNALIDMYHRCGCLEDAFAVFEHCPSRDMDVVAWNSMIAGFSSHGLCHLAFELLTQMQAFGMEPNLVTWNSVLSGYAQVGDVRAALRTLQKMKVETTIQPDCVSFTCALKACCSNGAVRHGKLVHMEMVKMGMAIDIQAKNSLVEMYLRCGLFEDAEKEAEEEEKDMATWTSMVVAYGEKQLQRVLKIMLQGMMDENEEMDAAAMASVMKASATIGVVDHGRLLHSYAAEIGLEGDEYVASATVDLYAKCGSLRCAYASFVGVQVPPSVAAWTAMIGGFAAHGLHHMALLLVQSMLCTTTLQPNSATLLCFLVSACDHRFGCCLHDGRAILASMADWFGVSPMAEHYSCCAHLLGRAGFLQEAEEMMMLLMTMGSSRSMAFCYGYLPEDCGQCLVAGWVSLLSSCRNYGNVEIARRCFQRLVALDWRNSAAFALMWSMYVEAGMTGEASRISEEWGGMKEGFEFHE